jgi:hypothetical protein
MPRVMDLNPFVVSYLSDFRKELQTGCCSYLLSTRMRFNGVEVLR